MAIKLIEWRLGDFTEVSLLDTIETNQEWNNMTRDEREQLEAILAHAQPTGWLIGRDLEDGNFITALCEEDIVSVVTQ